METDVKREEVNRKIEVMPTEGEDNEDVQTFLIHGEGHTFGNALRSMIVKNPDVEYCGYSVPHPDEDKLYIQIQTRNRVPASRVLRKGLNDLLNLAGYVKETFQRKVEEYKQETEAS